VDPYYLTYKAELVGYHPDVILSCRQINDGMGRYIAEQTVRQMIDAGSVIKGARVLVLGLTFKEDCADLRNSRVIDVIRELESYGIDVRVHDPVADKDEAKDEYGVELMTLENMGEVDAVVAAVAHRELVGASVSSIAAFSGGKAIPFIDVKSAYDRNMLQQAGFRVWRL